MTGTVSTHHLSCYDVNMPRTTLQLEEDALRAAKAHARRHRVSLGRAVSDLVKRATERPLPTEERNGLRVARLPQGSRKITTALIDRLRDEMP